MSNYSRERFSDSVLTEIQLRSLLKSFEVSGGEYVVLLVTPTPGSTAIANFNTSVWPAWIRPAIRQKLLDAGGVPSVSPLQIQKDSKGSPYVLPVKIAELSESSRATSAEPATEPDVPESSPTLSSVPTAPKPSAISKPCQHDWYTNFETRTTYCWNCGVEK